MLRDEARPKVQNIHVEIVGGQFLRVFFGTQLGCSSCTRWTAAWRLELLSTSFSSPSVIKEHQLPGTDILQPKDSQEQLFLTPQRWPTDTHSPSPPFPPGKLSCILPRPQGLD